MNKLFITTDTLSHRLTYTDSAYPLSDISRTKNVMVTASSGINALDIISEVNKLDEDLERYPGSYLEGAILRTVMTEYNDLILALTYKGFKGIAKVMALEMPNSLQREREYALALKLVHSRLRIPNENHQ